MNRRRVAHKSQTTVDEGDMNLDSIRVEINGKLQVERIQHMTKHELLVLQNSFGLGNEWGVIIWPKEWMPAHKYAQADHNLRQFSAVARNEFDAEIATITITRLLLICLCVPTKTRSRTAIHLKPTSLGSKMRYLWRPMIAAALEKEPIEKTGLLNRLDTEFLTIFESALFRDKAAAELDRISELAIRSLWWDLPQARHNIKHEESNIGSVSQRYLRTKHQHVAYLPLPDELVHQVGWRSAWIIRNLANPLMTVAEEVIGIHEEQGEKNKGKSPFTIKHHQVRNINKFLRTYDWTNCTASEGTNLEKLPFEFRIKAQSGVTGSIDWPPKNRNDVIQILGVVQMVNMFVVLLSSGSRASEVLSFKMDCLKNSPDGTTVVTGTTYKLSEKIDGEERDWPLPTLAVDALRNQIRLSRIAQTWKEGRLAKHDNFLWRNFNPVALRRNQRMLGSAYNLYMRAMIDTFGLSHLQDEQLLTFHRFRKTIARLIALALAHAPKILMDVFGHKSIEMTMHYILSDPNIRVEIQEVRRELILMRATDAIHSADQNGGPAAVPLRSAVKRFRMESPSAWGASNVHELAVLLTGNGDVWNIVRPGVICTKTRQDYGPCNIENYAADPARCRSSCQYRLEEASNRQAVKSTVAEYVKLLKSALVRKEDLSAEVYKGQIILHTKRFPDMWHEWSTDETIAPLIKSAAIDEGSR